MPTRKLTYLIALLTLLPAAAQARVYMVDDAEQLAAAIEDSNRTAEADIIDMSPGLYVLEQVYGASSQGLPSVQGDLLIRGNGAELRRYASDDYLLLHVADGGRLHLNALTLAEGSQGAIHNEGMLVMRRVRIVDHSTADRGEAIVRNDGVLELRDSELGYNLVDANGIHASVVLNHGRVLIEDTRFVDNRLSSRHPDAQIACALTNHGRAELRRVSISGCLTEQLNPDGLPKTVYNLPGAALLLDAVAADEPQIQIYGLPLTASNDEPPR